MSSITFNGSTSASKDVTVLTYPDIVKPTLRVETVKIPGRHGEVTLIDTPAYESRLLECECAVSDVSKISAASAWLTGRGLLILGNDPTYAYDAVVVDEIRFSRVLRGHGHHKFTVPFLCHPLKRLASTEADITLAVGGNVTNPGHVTSRPKVVVTGTGNITLMMGETITTLTGVSGAIVIDSDAGIATNLDGTANASRLVSGDWPTLLPGVNAVSWTGTVTSVVITPRWRYL